MYKLINAVDKNSEKCYNYRNIVGWNIIAQIPMVSVESKNYSSRKFIYGGNNFMKLNKTFKKSISIIQ